MCCSVSLFNHASHQVAIEPAYTFVLLIPDLAQRVDVSLSRRYVNFCPSEDPPSSRLGAVELGNSWFWPQDWHSQLVGHCQVIHVGHSAHNIGFLPLDQVPDALQGAWTVL